MADYIEREAFLKNIEERYCTPCKAEGKDHCGCLCRACWVDDMCGEVIDAPAADVVPVRHGRWLDNDDYMFCSNCGMQWNYCDNDTQDFNCCPNCGARMDLGDKNND